MRASFSLLFENCVEAVYVRLNPMEVKTGLVQICKGYHDLALSRCEGVVGGVCAWVAGRHEGGVHAW